MDKKILIWAGIFGVLAVFLGAFASHGLKSMIDPDQLASFQTGLRYQFYHCLFLLYLGNEQRIGRDFKKWIYYLVVVGVIFFSFSIYGLATNDLTNFNFKTIAMITPVGGLLLAGAWLIFIYAIVRSVEIK